ncbi:MAG: hypothetical protein ABID63_07080 [Pseudomonadota bacterium]
MEPHSERKSLSAETTFDTDIATLPELAAILTNMAARVARDLARKNIAGHTVVLKLKTADFKTRTRNMRLTYPSLRQDVITESAMTLLKKEIDGTKYRLLGVGVSELSTADEADPHDLFAADEDIQGEISEAEISHSSPVKLPRPTMEQLRESLTRPYRLRLRKPRQHHFEF